MGFFRRIVASIGYLGRIHKSTHRRVFVGLLLVFAVSGCTSVTPRFVNGGAFCPSGSLTNGSREFNGPVDFDITVDLTPTNMGKSINARVKMVAEGPGGSITREWNDIVHNLARGSEQIITAINPSSGRAFGTTPAAGSEFIACDDGDISTGPGELSVSGVIERIEVIGDTGAQDISDDSNCHCDTQIRSLKLTSVELTLDGGIVPPDRGDTTPPRISLWIHPTSPALDSPSTAPISMTGIAPDTPVRLCVYVNSPFRVSASASDEGGIRSIRIGPAFGEGQISLRGGVVARFPPSLDPDHRIPDRSYENPGASAGSSIIDVDYQRTPLIHNAGSLSGVYEFEGGTAGIKFRADARNFREDGPDPSRPDTSRALSQIWGYEVKPVLPGISAGTECEWTTNP